MSKAENGDQHRGSSCAWCGSSLAEIPEPYGVGASLDNPDQAAESDEFMIGIEVEGVDRTIYGLLPPPGSPARESGHDLWFVLCSEACGDELLEHLEGDVELL